MARFLCLLLLLGPVAVTFARGVQGGWVYDDLRLLAANPVLQGEHGLWAIVAGPLWGPDFPHWRPVTQVLLALGNAAAGPAGIHVLALAVHLGGVLLAFRLAVHVSGRADVGYFAALWFGLHPAQVESVSWCAALNDVLWGTAALAALAAHAAARHRGNRVLGWPAVGWFALALLAKETALVVPVLLALLDLVVTRSTRLAPRWGSYTRLLLVLAPWFLARALVFGDLRAGFDRGPELDLGARNAGLVGLEVLGRLLGVLVWPFQPEAMRPFPVGGGGGQGPAFVALGAAAVLGTLWLAWRGRGAVTFGCVAVVAVLGLHAAGLRGLGEYPVADRYLYVPALGLALAVLPWLLQRRAGAFVAGGIALAFAAASFVAVGAWADQAAFAEAQLARHEDARAHCMAGQLALESARPDPAAARAHFERAAELARAPRHGGEEGRVRLQADIATGLAWCEFFTAAASPVPDFRVAAEAFAHVVRAHPTHAQAHVGLGVCLAELGDPAAAERHFLRALAIDPTLAAARYNLARLRGW